MTAPAIHALRLWLCADLAGRASDEVGARVRAVCAAIPACVWLRPAADTGAAQLLTLARDLGAHAREHGGALLVGDRVDVALAADADGVHLGGRSIDVADARALLAKSPGAACTTISVAVHDAYQIRACSALADAMVLSPLYAVPGKGALLGVGGFATLVGCAPNRHFVALGGIDRPQCAIDAATAGARAIAVRRALLDTGDPVGACHSLHEHFVAALDRSSRE